MRLLGSQKMGSKNKGTECLQKLQKHLLYGIDGAVRYIYYDCGLNYWEIPYPTTSSIGHQTIEKRNPDSVLKSQESELFCYDGQFQEVSVITMIVWSIEYDMFIPPEIMKMCMMFSHGMDQWDLKHCPRDVALLGSNQRITASKRGPGDFHVVYGTRTVEVRQHPKWKFRVISMPSSRYRTITNLFVIGIVNTLCSEQNKPFSGMQSVDHEEYGLSSSGTEISPFASEHSRWNIQMTVGDIIEMELLEYRHILGKNGYLNYVINGNRVDSVKIDVPSIEGKYKLAVGMAVVPDQSDDLSVVLELL